MDHAKILLVTSEPAAAQTMVETLRDLGYAADSVTLFGQEVLGYVAQSRPDLVLLDVRLPGPLESARTARQIRSRFGVPVLYVVDQGDEDTLQRAGGVEPYDYVLRPCGAWELHAVVAMALHRRKPRRKQRRSKSRDKTTGVPLLNADERRALEEMWSRYEFIVNTSREFLTLIDANYVYQAVNEAYCQAHDKSREEIVGRTVAAVWGEQKFNSELKACLDECLAGSEVYYQSWFSFAALGRRCFDVAYYPYYGDGDQATHVVVVSRDITKQKQAEESLQRHRAILEAVSFAAERFLKAPSWEESLPEVLLRLGEGAGVSRAYVFENHADAEGELLTSQHCEWVSPGIAPQLDAPGLQGASYRHPGFRRLTETLPLGRPLHGHIKDFSASEQEVLAPQGIRSILVMPVFVGTEWWGFIGFDQCDAEREWSAAEIDALRTAADVLGAAIQRRQVEETNKENEERLRTLINAMPDIVCFKDGEGRWLEANQADLALFQLDGTAYYGKTDAQLAGLSAFYQDAFLTCQETDEQAWQQGVPCRGEEVVPCADGSSKVLDVVKVPLFHPDGRRKGLVMLGHDITEQKRAGEEIQRRTAQLETVRQLGLEITAQLSADADALLRTIVARAVELLGGGSGGLYIYRPERDVLEWIVAVGPDPIALGTTLTRGEGLSGRIWESNTPLVVDDYKRWEGRASVYDGTPHAAVAGAPVRWGDEFLGVVNISSPTVGAFSPADAELLDLFTTHAAIAMRNARILSAEEQQRRHAEALAQATAALTRTLELEPLLENVLEAAIQAMPSAERGSILLLDEATQQLYVGALAGYSDPRTRRFEEVPQRGYGFAALQQRRPLLIPDVARGPFEYDGDVEEIRSIRSAVVAPLNYRERVIGVISLDNASRTQAFTAGDQHLLAAFADQAAVAVENARLFLESRTRAEELSALNELGRALVQRLNVEQVLEEAWHGAARLLDTTNFYIALYQADEDEVVFALDVTEGVVQKPYDTQPAGLGLTGYVIRTRQPLLIRKDVERRQAELGVQLVGRSALSWLGVPLVLGERVLGVIAVQSYTTTYAYDEHDAELLAAIAAQVAIAVENAQLFTETRTSELRMQALYETSRALSSSLEEESLVRLILQAMDRSLDCEYVALALVDQEAQTIGIRHGIWDGEFDVLPEWIQMAQYPLEHTDILADVYRTGRTEIIGDWDERFNRALWDRFEHQRLLRIFMPIEIRAQVIGVAEVGYDKQIKGQVTEDEMQMLAAFMDQAGVAVENARLFGSLATEKERLELLYRLSHHLSESLDVHDVAQRALDDVCAVIGALRGVCFVREMGSQRLKLMAVSSYETESVAAMDQQLQLRIGIGLGGWVAEQRQPAIAPNVNADSRWMKVAGLDDWVRSALSVPLISGDELVGVLSIYSDRTEFFNREHLRLLESAAATVAASIANAQLYEVTRRRGLEQETVSRIARALNALDIEQAFPVLVQGLQSLTGCDRIALGLLEESREEIAVLALDGPLGDLETGMRIRVTSAASWTSLQTGRPHLTADLGAELDYPATRTLYEAGYRSRAGLPLFASNKLIGVLTLASRQVGAFWEGRLPVMEQIADALAIALENSRLFQAERDERALTEALVKAADAVSSTLDLDQVLDRILEQVERVVPGDAFNIMLIEGDVARVVRWRGYERLGAERLISGFSICITGYHNLRYMLQSGRSVIVPDTKADPSWVPGQGWEWLLAYMSTPIEVAGLTVGFLNVDGARTGQFSPADARRLEAFANHAATAIENAQLYHELQTYVGRLEEKVQARTAEIQAQYARLEAILRSTSDGIVVADGQGEIVQTNPVAHTWLEQMLSPEDAGRLREAIRSLARRAEERPEDVLELTGLDLQLRAGAISEPGMKEAAAVVAVHDISHIKALDRMKSRLVSNISHELRTPITTIKLYAGLIQRCADDKRAKYLETLVQEANRQARLVEDILQMSRIDAGRLELNLRSTTLNSLTGTTVANHEVWAESQGLRLLHCPEEPGPTVLVDLDQMAQVLNNLVSNAIRYTQAGGEIRVSTGHSTWDGRAWATVAVSDTGIGIPANEAPHIFERFFRGEMPQLMQTPGTGLGLAIVKEIVELHGGRVTVQSQPGAGSTFSVWLPIQAPH